MNTTELTFTPRADYCFDETQDWSVEDRYSPDTCQVWTITNKNGETREIHVRVRFPKNATIRHICDGEPTFLMYYILPWGSEKLVGAHHSLSVCEAELQRMFGDEHLALKVDTHNDEKMWAELLLNANLAM